MTHKEAQKLAAAATRVDGGCTTCASALTDDLKLVFPDHDWDALLAEAYEDEDAKYERLGYVRCNNVWGTTYWDHPNSYAATRS